MKVEEYRKLPKTKRTKYGAVKTGEFASKAESKRAGELKVMERAGEIFALSFHPRYVIIDKSQYGRALHYTADAEYVDAKTGATITEDVKGSRKVVSRDFPLRKRMFQERYGATHELRIKEIG